MNHAAHKYKLALNACGFPLLHMCCNHVLFRIETHLVEHDVALVGHEVVVLEAADEGSKQVGWEPALGLLWLTVVGAHDGLDSLGGSLQVVVGDLQVQVQQGHLHERPSV